MLHKKRLFIAFINITELENRSHISVPNFHKLFPLSISYSLKQNLFIFAKLCILYSHQKVKLFCLMSKLSVCWKWNALYFTEFLCILADSVKIFFCAIHYKFCLLIFLSPKFLEDDPSFNVTKISWMKRSIIMKFKWSKRVKNQFFSYFLVMTIVTWLKQIVFW